MRTLTLRLLVLSIGALLLELALIRWLGSEVRIFAYYKNLVLVSCFLGFGLGFYRSARPARLVASLGLLTAVVVVVSLGARTGWRWGPAMTSAALSNFRGSITMNDEAGTGPAELPALFMGLGWTTAIFVACQVVLFGFAQAIGAAITAFGPDGRLRAYGVNVLGSLLGVVGFSLLSWLRTPPVAWFLVACATVLPELRTWRARGAAVLAGVVIALALPASSAVVWSPYQKLEYQPKTGALLVNGVGYMYLWPIPKGDGPPPFFDHRRLDRWRLPHTVLPGAESVCIVGAGGGNDVSAALAAGAKRVVAVEIDPEIYRFGHDRHPDHPYQDPRVQIVLDDARHFGETTNERFDLVVFSHLDAHETLSSFTNVRLDNYIHTVNSFRAFRRTLRPGGSLYVSFWATQPWVTARLQENLRLAFGHPPATLVQTAGALELAHFFESDDPAVVEKAARIAPDWFHGLTAASVPPPSTDDWPFLYVEKHRVPEPMVWLTIPIALASLLVVAFFFWRSGTSAPMRLDRHYFFLGAAFLLVEVHNVGKLARVFGTTWTVNSWVISGILVVALLSTWAASRWRRVPLKAVYAVLVLGLALGATVPIETILALPFGDIVATAFYSAPLAAAGFIFASSFRDATDPDQALGSNILGAVIGGFLESASFVVGLSGLLWIAAGLYLLSIPASKPGTRS